MASAEFISAVAFLNSGIRLPVLDFPDYELYFIEVKDFINKKQFNLKPEVYEKIYGPYENKPKFICLISPLQPKSHGTISLKSANPYDPPLIDPNYFEDSRDINVVIEGLKMCQKIVKSEPMKRVGAKPFETIFPGCEEFFGDEDHYFECIIRSAAFTISHAVGTAKMGDPGDSTTVVDSHLRVKGMKGLRVVDASVMPIIPSGNTNAPVLMIAEKASDIIKETIDCSNYGYESDISFL